MIGCFPVFKFISCIFKHFETIFLSVEEANKLVIAANPKPLLIVDIKNGITGICFYTLPADIIFLKFLFL
jgi:hypothetical protein